MDVEITEEEKRCVLSSNPKRELRDGKIFTLNGERGFVLRDNDSYVVADMYDSDGHITGIKRFTNEELKMAEWE